MDFCDVTDCWKLAGPDDGDPRIFRDVTNNLRSHCILAPYGDTQFSNGCELLLVQSHIYKRAGRSEAPPLFDRSRNAAKKSTD